MALLLTATTGLVTGIPGAPCRDLAVCGSRVAGPNFIESQWTADGSTGPARSTCLSLYASASHPLTISPAVAPRAPWTHDTVALLAGELSAGLPLGKIAKAGLPSAPCWLCHRPGTDLPAASTSSAAAHPLGPCDEGAVLSRAIGFAVGVDFSKISVAGPSAVLWQLADLSGAVPLRTRPHAIHLAPM